MRCRFVRSRRHCLEDALFQVGVRMGVVTHSEPWSIGQPRFVRGDCHPTSPREPISHGLRRPTRRPDTTRPDPRSRIGRPSCERSLIPVSFSWRRLDSRRPSPHWVRDEPLALRVESESRRCFRGGYRRPQDYARGTARSTVAAKGGRSGPYDQVYRSPIPCSSRLYRGFKRV